MQITIRGWIHEWWLVPSDEMGRLVTVDPLAGAEPRYDDRDTIRWNAVAESAATILRQGRALVEECDAPDDNRSWNVHVTMDPTGALTDEEQRIVHSIFVAQPPCADLGSDPIINGRHRLYAAMTSGASALPAQSPTMSDWSSTFFGEDHWMLRWKLSTVGDLRELSGRWQIWGQTGKSVDEPFVAGIGKAIDFCRDWVASVTALEGFDPPAMRQ